MSERFDWQLRYRSPLSPTKGVDDVTIQTNSTDEGRAKVVAEFWLGKAMAHPGTKFVYVRRAVVQTEDDMIAEMNQKAKAEAVRVEPGDARTADVVSDAKGRVARVGA